MSQFDDSLDPRENKEEIEGSEIGRIATEVGTKQYFLTEQARNLDEWANNAS